MMEIAVLWIHIINNAKTRDTCVPTGDPVTSRNFERNKRKKSCTIRQPKMLLMT